MVTSLWNNVFNCPAHDCSLCFSIIFRLSHANQLWFSRLFSLFSSHISLTHAYSAASRNKWRRMWHIIGGEGQVTSPMRPRRRPPVRACGGTSGNNWTSCLKNVHRVALHRLLNDCHKQKTKQNKHKKLTNKNWEFINQNYILLFDLFQLCSPEASPMWSYNCPTRFLSIT